VLTVGEELIKKIHVIADPAKLAFLADQLWSSGRAPGAEAD
jgi:hypothetical protein